MGKNFEIAETENMKNERFCPSCDSAKWNTCTSCKLCGSGVCDECGISIEVSGSLIHEACAADQGVCTPPPTTSAAIRLGRETVIDFPAPKSRPDQEPLKPTGTDSLPVPRLQPYESFHTGQVARNHRAEQAPVAMHDSERDVDEGVRGNPGKHATRIAIAAAPPSRPKPPGCVGYRVALRHICSTVSGVLKETGLPLGDGPLQDLISTVFIAAQKDKAIDFDFGEEA